MKKLLYLIPCLMLALTSCEMFEFDNFEGHDAKVYGSFIDTATGEPVPMEIYTQSGTTYGVMRVTETGWDSEAVQSWMVKYTGKYRNNLVWAGDYKMDFSYLNVYNQSDVKFTLEKGENKLDFQVTPYARVKDVAITYDASVRKFKATFKVELGDATKANNGVDVTFAVNTNNYVGGFFNQASGDAGAKAANVTPGETITLYIDANPAGVNTQEFKYSRPHYFRVCALVKSTDNPYNLNNFSDVYVATPTSGSADNYTIEKYTWAE